MNIHVTTFEAECIALTRDVPLDQRHGQITTGHKDPCPFLSTNGTCSIYQQRPLFCRTYHSLSDPKLCATPSAVIYQYGTLDGQMGNNVYARLFDWVHYQNSVVPGAAIRDIRDFFPHEPARIQRHIAQNPLLFQ